MRGRSQDRRKRKMDCARLKFITDEIPLLRQVMGKGESAFFDNGGRNFPARTALQSLGAIGLAMSELSNVIQETEPTADWEGMRGLRNYIAVRNFSAFLPVPRLVRKPEFP